MITGIDHIHVVTLNMDESIAFYQKLGFRLVRRAELGPEEQRIDVAYLSLGQSTWLELLPALDDVDRMRDHFGPKAQPLALNTDDLEATLKDLEEKGVEIALPMQPAASFIGRVAIIRDPSGVYIEIREWQGGDCIDNTDWAPTQPGVRRTDK